MNLFLVRHGLTPWNVAGRLQGWANTDLTPEGVIKLSLGRKKHVLLKPV